MRVKLTRKLADAIDGVEIADFEVGDVLDLPLAEARLLIAEQWAIPSSQRKLVDVPRHKRDLERAS